MLAQTIKKYFRKHKRVIILVTLLIASLASCLGYMQYRVNRNERNQAAIVNYLKKNLDQQEKDKIQNHAIAIQLKMDKYKNTGNPYIDSYVVNLYDTAHDLAEEGNKACYVLENFGDDILKAYREGKKDGNKMWGSGNNSF